MPGSLRSLYICYLSLEDPLVETQVVAYLEGLAREGHTIHLMTFEPRLDAERKRRVTARLKARGIAWHPLRYHKRPSLPATVYDALVGAGVAVRLVRRHRLDAIHARSHVAAATGLIARRLTGCRLIFDIRGLLGDEYVEAGRWPRGGVAHRVTERIQRAAIARADGVVVLTKQVRAHLFGPGTDERVAVIPCCAELGRLSEDPPAAERARARLGLANRSIMVYVGKLIEPYLDREMVEFFAVARRQDPRLAFLVLTQAPAGSVVSELSRARIPESDYRIMSADPEELGSYLGTADFAIAFCRPGFARIAMSPTKVGEYLGARLPVVSGPGVGDLDELFNDRQVGVVVEGFSELAYEHAAARIRELATDPACRSRCREVAREVYSLEEVGIPRYDRLYRRLAQTSGDGPSSTR